MAINVVAQIELGDGSEYDIKDSTARALLDDHEDRLLEAESKVSAMYEDVDYLNQDAFSYIRVKKGTDNYDIISADDKKDVVTFVPGDNVSIAANTDTDTMTISAVDTTYNVTTTSKAGLCPTLPGGSNVYLRGDGTWASPDDTTYNVVSKSAAGLAPQLPNESTTTKYLRQDGTWVAPPNTTYSVVSKSANGLVPMLPNETSTTKYLRQDGTWVIPPNTTYSAATASANGLMSSTDKSKLDGIDSGANAYTHPAYTARTGQPTANASPAFGGTFTVSQISSDATGHVTAATNRTITIPSAVATTSAAGLCPKLGGGTTNFLRADGTWAAPAETVVPVVSKTANGLAPKLPNETTTTKYLRQDGTWAVPPDTNTTYSVVTTSANGLMAYGDKTKLNGIATGAEVNQNAFSNVAVSGQTTVAADSKTDTLTLVAGSNVTITTDATNDKVTIASTNTTYSAATTSANGLMSSADKTKLNGIASNAEVNQNAFSNIAIGSTTIAADSKTDTLTLSPGTGITLGAATSTDTVTISSNLKVFSKVKVGSTTIEADSTADTLTLTAGSGIKLTPDATNDKVTIASSAPYVTGFSRTTGDSWFIKEWSNGLVECWMVDDAVYTGSYAFTTGGVGYMYTNSNWAGNRSYEIPSWVGQLTGLRATVNIISNGYICAQVSKIDASERAIHIRAWSPYATTQKIESIHLYVVGVKA